MAQLTKTTYWQSIDHIIGPATIAEFDNIGQKPIRDAIESFIIANSNEQTRLLDAGCNTGIEGYRLFERGYKGTYYGADSNYRALQHARENLNGRRAIFCQADCAKIPYPDRNFDIVLTKDVIEHAPYYEDVSSELARLTNRFLLLSMFIRMHEQADFIKPEPAGFHHNRYNRTKLYEFMAERGLGAPKILFKAGDDELLIFEKK